MVPQVHGWIKDGSSRMTGRKFIAAVALRANTLPTRSRCTRGRGAEADRMNKCVACGPTVVENLSHILQGCIRTHGSRIARHNRVLQVLAKRLERKGWTVRVELRIMCSVGLRKPDLLVYKPGDQAWIIDVSVVTCSYSDLDLPHTKKVDYYESCPEIAAVVRVEAECEPTYSAFIMNWRGAIAPTSAADMRLLDLSWEDLKLLSMICVEQGSWIHRAHQQSNVVSHGLQGMERIF